jgi:hypothetical protein
MSTNPSEAQDLFQAIQRLRIASDALKFLADNVSETLMEASSALAEAKRSIEQVRAPRRIMQVCGVEGGDVCALTTDGALWRLHRFKDLDVWDQMDDLPEEAPTSKEVES